MDDPGRLRRFEHTVLVHLDAAHNLARWLARDAAVAEDAVQEASLRAFRFFDQMHGASAKAWFMAIVRNACIDGIKAHRGHRFEEAYDEDLHVVPDEGRSGLETPEAAAMRAAESRSLHACILALPLEYREVLVLRELEELSYKEIAAIVGVPIGTVMSRLSRGRDLLSKRVLDPRQRKAR